MIPCTIQCLSRDHLDHFRDARKVTFEQDFGLSQIHSMAFVSFRVMEITIPASISLLGEKCFSRCQNLSRVLFESGSKLEVIKSCCFYRCRQLKEIEFKGRSLKVIEDGAFVRTGIEKIVIPSSVESLGRRCFASCPNLKCVSFENHSRLSILEELFFDLGVSQTANLSTR